ncbi:hypothetical protein DV736_g664, partial [Chaetothyriales sp. CBS 134916]
MAAQARPRSRPSLGNSRLSRQTSTHSRASNVFSDEHAYSDGEITPDEGSPESPTLAPYRGSSPPNVTTAIPRSSLALSFTQNDRLSYTSSRGGPSGSTPLPHPAVAAAATNSDATTQRTLSSSSRFSIPRPQSPYRGPTAPSQPYALYPQVTRASSIASESTIRPAEQAFVAQGGPEHPYAMYQNTVPEEADDNSGDEDESSQHLRVVPLGFSSGPSTFGDRSTSSGNDTGDIVGSDGHIEQLPPYSRFADNVIAKGDMASIDTPSTTLVVTSTSQSEHTASTGDESEPGQGVGMNAVAREPMEEDEQVARKENWLAKSKRRKCCGLPLLTIIILGFAIFAAAALGGIIGGVIGNQKGTDRAIASTAATTTVWLDADPASTGPGTPPCPTGHFTIPVSNTIKVGSCVVDQQNLGTTWDCMNHAYLGISVFDHGPGQPYQVAFDDYSVLPKLFQYGPQPPDFNGTSFTLSPAQDKDDGQLGVGMFFSHLFDKLIILESDALDPRPRSNKRSVSASHIQRRAQNIPRGTYLNVADKPWYCFWNSTVEEFWIFLDQDVNPPSSASSASTSWPSSSITAAPFGYSPTPTISIHKEGYPPPPPPPATTQNPTNDPNPSPVPSHPPPPKLKRSSPYTDSNSQNYFPKLIKMVEKRKPVGNVTPYCQQMQVLNDWQIMPIASVQTIAIEETDFAKPTGSRRRWTLGQRSDPKQELESNCVCEYFNSPLDGSS